MKYLHNATPGETGRETLVSRNDEERKMFSLLFLGSS